VGFIIFPFSYFRAKVNPPTIAAIKPAIKSHMALAVGEPVTTWETPELAEMIRAIPKRQ